jgi:hypothetical protein
MAVYGSQRQPSDVFSHKRRFCMISNMRLKKVCAFCKKVFVAKTTVTRCCSDACAKKNYKKRQRDEKLANANGDTKEQMQSLIGPLPATDPVTDNIEKELINVIELSIVTGLSERTLFRLMKDPKFPVKPAREKIPNITKTALLYAQKLLATKSSSGTLTNIF